MNKNPNQPREFDAVKGGQAPPPVEGVVLGGLLGVKHRLKSTVARERAATLIEALRYGEKGLDLVIEALEDSSDQVQLFAGRLLQQKGGKKGLLALKRHNPWLLFTKLEDWKVENFEPDIGITYPDGTAYQVNLYRLEQRSSGDYRTAEDFTLELFQALVKDSRVLAVEALACWFSEEDFTYGRCETFVNALCKASKQLTNLKALFIGDRREHEYQKSRLVLSGICKVLEAFPQLEVLKLHGNPYGLFVKKLRHHDRLKTLIIETADNNSRSIAQICELDLPALQYLDLWGGRHTPSGIDSLKPLLTGQLFPSLYYLGLLSFKGTDELVKAIAKSPVCDRLAVLNLSLGDLTDKGAEILLNCKAINKLHTLNVAKNYLSTDMIQRLSDLNCRVITQPQYDDNYRYMALYE